MFRGITPTLRPISRMAPVVHRNIYNDQYFIGYIINPLDQRRLAIQQQYKPSSLMVIKINLLLLVKIKGKSQNYFLFHALLQP